jgi:hypothetical protein
VQHKQKGCVYINSFEIRGIVVEADSNDKPTCTVKLFDWLKITELTWLGADLESVPGTIRTAPLSLAAVMTHYKYRIVIGAASVSLFDSTHSIGLSWK